MKRRTPIIRAFGIIRGVLSVWSPGGTLIAMAIRMSTEGRHGAIESDFLGPRDVLTTAAFSATGFLP